MVISILANILLPVFLVAGISAVAQRRLKLDVESFSKAAFYVFSPALVIDALLNSEVSGTEYATLAVGLIVTMLVVWGLGEAASRLFRLKPETRTAFLVTTLLANTGNYGLPVTLFAFGQAGLARAALLVTVNALMRSSLGVYIAARGQATSTGDSLRKVFSVPVIYAASVGIVFTATGWTLPEPVMKAASILGQGLVPCAFVVLGAQILRTLQEQRKTSHTGALVVATLIRLVLAPVIAYGVGGAIGLSGLARNVLTLESATPSAIMALVLANEFKADVPFAALAVLVTTLASLVTITLWLSWLM